MRAITSLLPTLALIACSASPPESTAEEPSELSVRAPIPPSAFVEPSCSLDSDCANFKSNDATLVPECNNLTRQCELVPVGQVVCQSFIRNQHHCPMGYVCKFSSVPDVGGRCVPTH